MKIIQYTQTILADSLTPVMCYMRVRSKYKYAALLESNDYGAQENSRSIVGFDVLADIDVTSDTLSWQTFNGNYESVELNQTNLCQALWDKIKHIQVDNLAPDIPTGFYGHTSFECVRHFDSLDMSGPKSDETSLMRYFFYRYLVVFDHFKDLITLVENRPIELSPGLDNIKHFIQNTAINTRPKVHIDHMETRNMSDQEFLDIIAQCKTHCRRGDVFQIVPSRRFDIGYTGDEFQIYRVLRTVNPSPYLYFFDFDTYSIFGSSPEHQLIIKDGKAIVNPIAGTYRRTGDDVQDRKRASALAEDPKEQSEHMMLVDLARNDLSKHTTDVVVSKMKEIKYYSHVIHLVSQVEGKLPNAKSNPIQIFGDTFPAGTLSGAPKYKALELIHSLEPHARSFYGGGIGYFGLDGDIQHAIVIRSFLARNGELSYQAGAGIVDLSDPQSELEEVNNKLGALRTTLEKVNVYFPKNSLKKETHEHHSH